MHVPCCGVNHNNSQSGQAASKLKKFQLFYLCIVFVSSSRFLSNARATATKPIETFPLLFFFKSDLQKDDLDSP